MNTEKKETGRVEAFSDGVFAIALTLLILDVIAKFKLPTEPKELEHFTYFGKMGEDWPVLVTFLISFVAIGIMWLNHHKLFTLISRVNHTLLIINLLVLLSITIVPFPTAILGEAKGEELFHQATIIYNGAFLLMALSYHLLWRYSTYRGRLLDPDTDMQAVNRISRQYFFGPVLYIIAFALSWWTPPVVSLTLQGLLAAFFLLPGIELKKPGVLQNLRSEKSEPSPEPVKVASDQSIKED